MRSLLTCFLPQVLFWLLPWSLRKYCLATFLGFRIGEGARIGYSLIGARAVEIGDGASIGHLNYIGALDALRLSRYAVVGHLNWISCSRNILRGTSAVERSLNLEEHSGITNRHLFDCSDKIEVGAFTTVAGWRSQFLTHSIDLRTSIQVTAPIVIGRYCFVGTGVIVLKGAVLPDRCILAAGAVFSKSANESWYVYGGVPAIPIKAIDKTDAYFSRARGWID